MVSVPSVFTSGYVNTETILYFFILTQLTFHVSSPQTGSFPQTKNRNLLYKISFPTDPYIHSLCCLVQELLAID